MEAVKKLKMCDESSVPCDAGVCGETTGGRVEAIASANGDMVDFGEEASSSYCESDSSSSSNVDSEVVKLSVGIPHITCQWFTSGTSC